MKKMITGSLLALAFCCATVAQAAEIRIVNMDGPNEGFNDPTRAKRVGGNPGRTLGEQRLIAFQFAADVWGATLTSPVEIKVQASFDPLACDATSAVLGSAGAIQIFSDFPNAKFPATWYPVALANKLAGQDLAEGPDGTSADDIRARFNSEIGKANCLTGSPWYLGLDANEPAGAIDLVAVLLHEFGHGLGFASYVNESNGSEIRGLTDIYSRQLLDKSLNKTWDVMNGGERRQSAINTRNVVWTGGSVLANVANVLQLGTPSLFSGTTSFTVGTASFGAQLTEQGVTGLTAIATDGTAAGTLACGPVVNNVAGKIAIVDRGTCNHTVKAFNVQQAGAIGMIEANNVAGSPAPGMGGSDPNVTIPAVQVTQTEGTTLKSQAGSEVTLGLDMSMRAGADAQGRPFVWTPNPVDPGSSVSHWDVLATRNQLMEPSINSDLTHSVTAPVDLSFDLLKDLGW